MRPYGVEVFRSKIPGLWRWRLVQSGGTIIHPRPYTRRANARRGALRKFPNAPVRYID